MHATDQPGRVLVIGSINSDFVSRTGRLPAIGETIPSERFEIVAGGKGANQAVAAARMGARVSMIACIGRDGYGAQRLRELEADGIDCAGIEISETDPTGLAMITVSATGENTIVVAAGANGCLSPRHLAAHADRFGDCDVVVCQLETPYDTVFAALSLARRYGKITVLNPAPATEPLPARWMPLIDYLVPNEVEASILAAGSSSAEQAARVLQRAGASHVLVTLGARGVCHVHAGDPGTCHAVRAVQAIDTTAAGDTFVGVLAAELSAGRPLAPAVRRAQLAASLCVQRHGARPSIPTRAELVDEERSW